MGDTAGTPGHLVAAVGWRCIAVWLWYVPTVPAGSECVCVGRSRCGGSDLGDAVAGPEPAPPPPLPPPPPPLTATTTVATMYPTLTAPAPPYGRAAAVNGFAGSALPLSDSFAADTTAWLRAGRLPDRSLSPPYVCRCEAGFARACDSCELTRQVAWGRPAWLCVVAGPGTQRTIRPGPHTVQWAAHTISDPTPPTWTWSHRYPRSLQSPRCTVLWHCHEVGSRFLRDRPPCHRPGLPRVRCAHRQRPLWLR